MAQYANGDTLIGRFVGTHLDGYGVYILKASGLLRYTTTYTIILLTSTKDDECCDFTGTLEARDASPVNYVKRGRTRMV